jgi:hypothetical protein
MVEARKMGTNWSTSSTPIGTGCGALALSRPPFAIRNVIQRANHVWVFLAFSKLPFIRMVIPLASLVSMELNTFSSVHTAISWGSAGSGGF